MTLLEMKQVTVAFGGLVAVNQVDVAIQEGEILAVIGPNGAGKTTLFNAVTGVNRPQSGAILLHGHSLVGRRPHQVVRLGIARTFQNIRLFKSLTVLENVLVGRRPRWNERLWHSLWRGSGTLRQRAEALRFCEKLMAAIGLGERANDLASELPYGEQRLVEIARALASEPKLLLLDEPAAGMSAAEKERLMALVRRIRDEMGKTIVLIDHDMSFVMKLAERVVVLDHGVKIADGAPAVVQSDQKVREAYLGTGRRAAKSRLALGVQP